MFSSVPVHAGRCENVTFLTPWILKMFIKSKE